VSCGRLSDRLIKENARFRSGEVADSLRLGQKFRKAEPRDA